MSISRPCAHSLCGKPIRLNNVQPHHWIRCPDCGHVQPVTPPSAAHPNRQSGSEGAADWPVRFDAALSVAMLGWVAAVTLGNLAGSLAVFWATAAMIATICAVAVFLRIRRRAVLVFAAVALVPMFALLHQELFVSWGADNYLTAEAPTFGEWIGFSAAQVVRAVDVLDALDVYGLRFQSITQASAMSGAVVVASNLVFDAFLLSAAFFVMDRLRQRYDSGGLRLALGCGVMLLIPAFFLVLLVVGIYSKPTAWGILLFPIPFAPLALAHPNFRRPVHRFVLNLFLPVMIVSWAVLAFKLSWSPEQFILWPLDNVLRILDVGDVMQAFGIQLHSAQWRFDEMPPSPIEAIADIERQLAQDPLTGVMIERMVTILFRTVAALYLFLGYRYIRFRALRGLGLSVDRLIAALKDEHEAIRAAAATTLGEKGEAGRTAFQALVVCLGDPYPVVYRAAESALNKLDPGWWKGEVAKKGAAELVTRLDDLWSPDDPEQRQDRWVYACNGLGRIGRPADLATPILVDAVLKEPNPEIRAAALKALQALGQAGGPPGKPPGT